MTDDETRGDDAAELLTEASELIQAMGFTEYQAKCFLALTRLESGTAKEVSEVGDVPRARVYDCMDALAEAGLVNVQESTPRRFRAVSPGEAVSLLNRRHQRRVDRLESLLPRLRAPDQGDDDGEIWVIEGRDEVSERLRSIIADADEEVLLAVAVEDLLTEAVEAALVDAAERGVTVTVGSPSEQIRSRLDKALPGSEVVETWTWWETVPIQPGALTCVVMVDGDALLASSDAAPELPDARQHRAVWTANHDTPLVAMLQPLLASAITAPTSR